jgi:hypothetical protein
VYGSRRSQTTVCFFSLCAAYCHDECASWCVLMRVEVCMSGCECECVRACMRDESVSVCMRACVYACVGEMCERARVCERVPGCESTTEQRERKIRK